MADWPGGGHGFDIAAFLAAKGVTALTGVAGAFVAHLFPPYKPWRSRLLEYFGGAITSLHVGPVAGPLLYNALMAFCDFWHIPPAQAFALSDVQYLAGFLCGALGLGVMRGLIEWSKRWAKDPKIGG